MIPEAGMTLDSILEGILSERESEEDEVVGDHLVTGLRESPEKFSHQPASDKLFFYHGYKPVIKAEFGLDPQSDLSPANVFSTRDSNPAFPNFVKIRTNGSIVSFAPDDPDSQHSSEQSVYSIKTEIADSCTDTDTVPVCMTGHGYLRLCHECLNILFRRFLTCVGLFEGVSSPHYVC